jgi:hypothetical protein
LGPRRSRAAAPRRYRGALVEHEALKDTLDAQLQAAVDRQTSALPAAQERRRRELLASLDATAETLNAKLRAVFARVLPDWRDGRVRFRWTEGVLRGVACVRVA